MTTTKMTDLERVHRLLFRALVEMRAQGHEHKNKLVFHLADLFHQCVLDLEAAASGDLDYETVMQRLQERASEKQLDSWLAPSLEELETEVILPQ